MTDHHSAKTHKKAPDSSRDQYHRPTESQKRECGRRVATEDLKKARPTWHHRAVWGGVEGTGNLENFAATHLLDHRLR